MLYAASWRGRYPHMREVDMPIWNRFLDRYGDQFDSFEYDVRVGPASGAAAGFDPQTVAVFEALTRLRIDAVGHRSGGVWLFEVSPHAGISKVGQCIGYRQHYVRDRKPATRPRMGIVTDGFHPAVGEVFKAQGIEVWIV